MYNKHLTLTRFMKFQSEEQAAQDAEAAQLIAEAEIDAAAEAAGFDNLGGHDDNDDDA